jgi:hypothetical protein
MAFYRYKTTVTDSLEEAYDIVKNVGRMLQEGKIDKESTLSNLAKALKKIETAKYYVDRE